MNILGLERVRVPCDVETRRTPRSRLLAQVFVMEHVTTEALQAMSANYWHEFRIFERSCGACLPAHYWQDFRDLMRLVYDMLAFRPAHDGALKYGRFNPGHPFQLAYNSWRGVKYSTKCNIGINSLIHYHLLEHHVRRSTDPPFRTHIDFKNFTKYSKYFS